MLETKNLTKIYKPKKGVPVKAIDGVSLKLPDSGMIFLLGKSGSGKSTLLNLLGGLDKYDQGEIIIKGISSKTFKQSHFDSYRNTYVGFIFQEYNVLEEFSVGANIALAIELQGRKAGDEEINRILHEVDLDGYGNRKPNELSGGQMQRVAIARALVKNPEIIMADEPTGALDSATGKQVFDTLKKLSKDKLVIVVSHDRDFAEQYADRIIELADGRVISDVESAGQGKDSELAQGDSLSYNGELIEIPAGYHLTQEDLDAINNYIDSLSGKNTGIKVTGPRGGGGKDFVATDTDKISNKKTSEFKLIKSRLPLKSAFKIGANGLKYKKFRLVITILLSCIAFGLFGLADTFGAYNHIKTCTASVLDSGISYASVSKEKKINTTNNFYYRSGYRLRNDELKEIYDSTGVSMTGIYTPLSGSMDFSSVYDSSAKFSETDLNIYAYGFNGFAEITKSKLDSMGYTITAGALPDGTKNEIAISKYVCETFIKGGYTDGSTYTDKNGEIKTKYETVSSYADMVGKTLELCGKPYKITCVVDTKLDLERYKGLTKAKENTSTGQQLLNYALFSELNITNGYSLNQVVLVGEGFVTNLIKAEPTIKRINNGYLSFTPENTENYFEYNPEYLGTLDDVKPEGITWLNGEKTVLGEKEIIISSDLIGGAAARKYPDAYGDDFTGGSTSEIISALKNSGTLSRQVYLYDTNANDSTIMDNGYTIVGYIDSEKYPSVKNTVIAHKSVCEGLIDFNDGIYNFAVGPMPAERGEVRSLVSYCYGDGSDFRYRLMNSVTYELDTVNETLQILSKVFLYIGLGFALFAALMLANFISTSISYKKQEIGILRAIGSRSNDVFRIFFAESFIIAMINFLLSAIGVGVATLLINNAIRNKLGVLITVLNFGIRQISLLLVISVIIAAAASFIPVKKIASKRPIDAIRKR